jgi:hypothetical protein
MIPTARRCHMVIALLLSSLAPAVGAAQTLETETARLLRAGWWKIGNAFEFQTSSDGTELAIPVAIEYGLTDNLEFLVEPVPYTAIRPRVGRQARGVGDVEATLTYRFLGESRSVPALALAAEVKLPTARDTLIGTRRTDYAGTSSRASDSVTSTPTSTSGTPSSASQRVSRWITCSMSR